ncbi:MAG: aldo/keto reductase [Verrucomicrobiaceae bacterium]|nr:MAG: aldo/keto reductase [Verrucomicrobiaceae bacterium]
MAQIALGTVQFGMRYGIANQSGQVCLTEARKMLELAAVNNIGAIDTAIAYGESESCLGEIGVQGFKVVTKLPVVPEDCPDVRGWVYEQVAASMTRLRVSSLYGLLLHRSEQLFDKRIGNKLYDALQEIKASGQVRKVGVSIQNPHELERIITLFPSGLVQAPFNLVDRRLHTGGWLSRLKGNDIEVHTRSVFLQGLLLMSLTAIPAQFSSWGSLWTTWHAWLSLHDISALQACLAFPMGFQEIDSVVVGADSARQLQQILIASIFYQQTDLPSLQCEDEKLINPACWLPS